MKVSHAKNATNNAYASHLVSRSNGMPHTLWQKTTAPTNTCVTRQLYNFQCRRCLISLNASVSSDFCFAFVISFAHIRKQSAMYIKIAIWTGFRIRLTSGNNDVIKRTNAIHARPTDNFPKQASLRFIPTNIIYLMLTFWCLLCPSTGAAIIGMRLCRDYSINAINMNLQQIIANDS